MNIRRPYIASNSVQLLFVAALSALMLCSMTSCATKGADGKHWVFVPVNAHVEKGAKTDEQTQAVSENTESNGAVTKSITIKSQYDVAAPNDPMAYDPNGPIEVKRLPSVDTESTPETAPISPAIGNQITPDGSASININGYVNGGASFRGQSGNFNPQDFEQMIGGQEGQIRDFQVLSDVPLSEAQPLPPQNFAPTPAVPYSSPTIQDFQPETPYPAPAAPGVSPGIGTPLPFNQPQGGVRSAWTPPGIQPSNGGQWPQDEFIADGGMGPKGVKVHDDFSVSGLEPENTIVHFDTIDGKVGVEASNRVEIYAPKFRAVRQVIYAGVNENVQKPIGYDGTRLAVNQQRNVSGMQSKQHLAYGENIAAKPGEQFIGKVAAGESSNRRQMMMADNSFRAYENLKIIKTGVMDRSETGMLAESIRRAASWGFTSNPQVAIDYNRVMAVVKDEGPGIVYQLDKDTHNPKVRIVKIASVEDARPGDHIEFTIRFDNVGDEPVGNVTILDSLTGRLEYAEGSAQCSKKGAFMTEPNKAGSLVLRWEIEDPLEPGEGGIIRFECVVR
ncbi:MAG: hypothetical protein IKX40_09690 [Thermoguttaceae bacterium]|nr:hypothetical protein [Thermoguttaceae bacterium]